MAYNVPAQRGYQGNRNNSVKNKITSSDFAAKFSEIVPQVKSLLPEHVPFERFERVVRMAVNKNKSLLGCDARSLFTACINAAADGLLPDGREGAIIPRKGVACWQPMVAGLMKLARNSGDIASISAQVVFEGEKFRFVLGDEEHIEHERDLTKTGGRIIAAYAVARLKDGSDPIREVMSWQQIEKVKKVSMAKDGPWKEWPDEMARKSVIRRLSKRLPMSTDREYSADSRLQSAIERVDELSDVNSPKLNEGTVIEAADDFALAANGIEPEDKKDDTPSLFDRLKEAKTADEVAVLSEEVREEMDKASLEGNESLVNSLDAALEDAHRRTFKEEDGA